MVSPQVVAMYRREVANFMTQRAQLQRETTARGEYGEPLHVWEIVAQSVPAADRLGRRNERD